MKYNLVGQKFGKLIVVELAEPHGSVRFWRCICDCGSARDVRTNYLISGHTTSCGCNVKKHGKARKERLYNIWVGMRQRCRDVNRKDYPQYGGRGITVCTQWSEDYISFRKWACQNGYNDLLSIDRIDPNGNYCPENCRWTDIYRQNNNTRSNVNHTHHGQTHTLAEWARLMNMSYKLLLVRRQRGWSFERAISEGVHRHDGA